MLRHLVDQKNPPTKYGTVVRHPKVGMAQRVKFWGTLLIIIASLATVTFWVRSRQQNWLTIDGPGSCVGITYARVAYTEGDFSNTTVFRDSHGNTSIPTCVAFTDTEVLVGHDALQQAHANPTRTVCNAGRFLAARWSSPKVQSLAPNLPYQIIEGENDSVAVQMVIAGKLQTYTPTELVGLLIGHLRATAEAVLGKNATDAVIGVPADFDREPEAGDPAMVDGDLDVANLKAAAALAGITVQRVVREPITAALAYRVDQTYVDKKIVVYDMGGEKLEISIVDFDDGIFEMLDTVKIPVGGRQFNERVVKDLLRRYSRKNAISTADITAESLSRLHDGVEMAKRRLSTKMVTRIEIPSFHKSLPLNESLTRHKFEELNKDLFQSSLDALQTLLDEAKLKPADIDDVIFTGGSSYVPRLRFQLEMFFNKKYASKLAGDAVVAGAAIQGAVLFGYADEDMGCPMDIHPLSIGIVMTLLPLGPFRDGETKANRFTAVPTRKIVKIMAPRDQGEGSKVVINVAEGERLHAKDNLIVGGAGYRRHSIAVQLCRPKRGLGSHHGTRRECQQQANGILAVIAFNPANKKETRIAIVDFMLTWWRTSQSKVYDDAHDNQLVESLLLDGEKHWDIEYPLMQQYTKIVDLQSFALAAKEAVLGRMILPEAVGGRADSMRYTGPDSHP
ncbi:78 KDA glucose-regulated protein-like protein precursor [Apiospora sp. TS-2023a]